MLNRDAINRANALILERLAGVPANLGLPSPGTAGESDPNVSQSCDDARSAADSTSRSSLAPQQAGAVLRLVWSA
jgi:hypothetical protein